MDGSVCDWSARAEETSRHLPIIGARCLTRLLDNLGAADLDLPVGAAARLDTATESTSDSRPRSSATPAPRVVGAVAEGS